MSESPIQLQSRSEITRREALQLFGAGLAVLQAGCLERPGEEIRPSVRRPEFNPGTPLLYATSMVLDGFATGLLVEAHGGRPTKIEGNPAHPASLGATLPQHQASILDLYDPHRLRAPQAATLPVSWDRVHAMLARLAPGEVWLVLPPDASPSLAAMLQRVRARIPNLRVVQHGVQSRRALYRGAELAFGAPLEQQLAFDDADVVVAFDSDFLASGPMSVRWSREFAARRRQVEVGETPIRMFVAEPMLTPTGSLADHRLAIPAGDVAAAVILLAEALDRQGVSTVSIPEPLRRAARQRMSDPAWIDLVARALVRAKGPILVVGERQPAAVHALVHRLSLSLGAIRRTTTFTESVLGALDGPTLGDLASAIRAGQVGTVIAIDTDPVHDAPGDLDLAALLRQVPLTVHATRYLGATSQVAGWVLPTSHYLESWGDARAYDGTASPIQPLIQPLHDTRSRLQLLAMLAGEHAPDELALVRRTWRSTLGNDAAWHAVLAEGVIPGTAAPPRTTTAQGDGDIVRELGPLLEPRRGLELDLSLSPSIHDGSFANNPWLQELPHPITKLTWGNAALLSPATAARLRVSDGDVLRVVANGRNIDLPALRVPGHADGCITVELGYGYQVQAAPIANGVGANAAVLGGPIVRSIAARPTGRKIALARTQEHFHQHGRELAPHVDLATYRENPDFTASHRGPLPTLLGERRPPQQLPQWGMTIDTTICTGCSSCVIACQAENNIPVVGPAGVRRGREMHWLRIDTYYAESNRGVAVVHQPMLCQHCEHAPCEYVCPVFATTHSPDGLNEMTYNRCIGTRFCSNNCPYKVRRFNWFAYDKPVTLRSLQFNPDVTVRERGVMEKCTFCVQRIRGAETTARMEKRSIAPGEVVTACQQACPTGAIQFGALQHTETPMMQWRSAPRLYASLHEVGTRPRVMYLAKIDNPDSEAKR